MQTHVVVIFSSVLCIYTYTCVCCVAFHLNFDFLMLRGVKLQNDHTFAKTEIATAVMAQACLHEMFFKARHGFHSIHKSFSQFSGRCFFKNVYLHFFFEKQQKSVIAANMSTMMWTVSAN